MRANNELKGENNKLEPFREVYVGHTDISNISKVPVNIVNLWCMDTGAGFKGKLTFMNIDTKEIYQSDECKQLYGEYYENK